ncbi:MAG: hypothetical protein J6B62_00030, partial [Bacteroidales bacterium]|nr:hypothetical protein [Bacteroidales bacterium]
NSRLSYVYDAFGRMKTMDYGENIVSSDIAYNIRNWMTEMTGDVFSMKLRYESPLYARPRFSGNIAELEWKSGADSVNTYAFDYDELSRVLGARRYFNGVSSDSFTEKNISYDLNGNILSLQRLGDGRLTDDLKYTYSGNRLASIDDSGRTGLYGYDLNGNIVSDGYNGLQLSNNILNLTESVSDNSGLLVTYSYLPDGTKLSALDSTGNGLLYLGSMVFAIKDGTVSLKSAGFSGGRFMPSGSFGEDNVQGQFVPYYHIVDHLGSVRAVVDGSDGSVVERDDYYPFGQRWSSSWPAVSENRFHFNSKEDQSLFGTPYIDYGARQYDPAIARWNAVDPLAEKYYPVTPYAFCADNAVNFVDWYGMDRWSINPLGFIEWESESDYDELYYKDNDGNLTESHIVVGNENILKALGVTNGSFSSFTSKTGINDIFKVFKFASDNTDVEWVVHKNGDTYTLGTKHDPDNSGGWVDYGLEKPDASVHSHPGNIFGAAKELESMGFIREDRIHARTINGSDWSNVRDDVHENGKQTRMNYVYFQKSHNLYHVEYNKPRYIRNINNYKKFYFGTLNNR